MNKSKTFTLQELPDKEMLDKAAEMFVDAQSPIADPEEFARKAFKQGASWLLSQPLSERLTDKEKEKIRNIYSDYIQIFHLPSGKAVCEVLTTIFNKECFNIDYGKEVNNGM